MINPIAQYSSPDEGLAWADLVFEWEIPTRGRERRRWLKQHARIWKLEIGLGLISKYKKMPAWLNVPGIWC